MFNSIHFYSLFYSLQLTALCERIFFWLTLSWWRVEERSYSVSASLHSQFTTTKHTLNTQIEHHNIHSWMNSNNADYRVAVFGAGGTEHNESLLWQPRSFKYLPILFNLFPTIQLMIHQAVLMRLVQVLAKPA